MRYAVRSGDVGGGTPGVDGGGRGIDTPGVDGTTMVVDMGISAVSFVVPPGVCSENVREAGGCSGQEVLNIASPVERSRESRLDGAGGHSASDASVPFRTPPLRVTVLGTSFAETPLIVPTSDSLERVRALMVGDMYVGRGSRQRGLTKSVFCNPFRVSDYGRSHAVKLFHQHLDGSHELQRDLWLLSGLRLLCHCQRGEECHGDVLILKFKEVYPTAFDRDRVDQPPPSSSILNYLARLREAPRSDGGSTSDEGVPPKNSGWRGPGKPMQVGTGYLQRDYCDGQSLASPGRWPVDQRRYPSSRQWNGVVRIFRRFTEQFCTPDLLMRLALGRVEACPFDSREVSELKESVIKELASEGLHLTRKAEDRADVPIDFRFFDLLLRSSEDPEVGLGEFAVGVRVGPGARMPRLPALYKPKK